MANCSSFLGLLRKCVWSGELLHESHQCDKRPRGEIYQAGECVNSINFLMQSRDKRSDGKESFANVTVADFSVSAMVDNGASVCLISEYVVYNNDQLLSLYQKVKFNSFQCIGMNATLNVIGKVTTPIALSRLESALIEFLVVNEIMNYHMLLGLNFLEDHFTVIETVNRNLVILRQAVRRLLMS